jgi:hypothetical protein
VCTIAEINFTKNHITGSVLLQKLDMEVLKKELGITSYGARAEILDRIASIPYQRRARRALRPSSGIHSTLLRLLKLWTRATQRCASQSPR